MPYLDHAGAALPSVKQMEEIYKLQSHQILANPHSHHATALKTRQIVDSARLRILRHFRVSADDYIIVFTHNTTHSLKIVAENFRFDKKSKDGVTEIGNKLQENKSQYAYLADSHHSVVGLREIVRDKVDAISCIGDDDLRNIHIPPTNNSLFVLTTVSNFCGRKYDLELVRKLQEKGWSVCLDAASLVSSSILDLSIYKPEFVAFSFYKIFGYPTGIGALLIRKDSINLIPKTSFAGGTVQSVDDSSFFHVLRDHERAYEEGTLNYYGISQLQKGFEEIERCGGMMSIQKRTHQLAKQAFDMLRGKVHDNKKPVVEVYNQSEWYENSAMQGPIVAFNLMRPDGGYYGYTEVEKLCSIFGIELRTGCFCNIGACKKYLKMSPESIQQNIGKGKQCGDEMDLIDGRPTGAIRISFGRQSCEDDILALEQLIDTCFVGSMTTRKMHNDNNIITSYTPVIQHLFSYPVKSCGSKSQNRQELTIRGFKNDREFMIVQNNLTLTLKTHPVMCRLFATVMDDTLCIQTDDENHNLSIPLSIKLSENDDQIVCKNRVSTLDCGEKIGKWIDDALDIYDARLLRVAKDSNRSFVNDSPFLLINEASVYMLSQVINIPVDEVIRRFRSNIVVRGLPPFIEDTAKNIRMGELEFEVVDKCTRCEMICIDPETGEKDPSLLLALREFRNQQRMTFGIYIRQTNFEEGQHLETGMTIHFQS